MKLNSILLIPFIMGLLALAIWSGWNVWATNGSLAWAGAFLATAPLPSFLFGVLAITRPARTSARLPLYQLVTLVGASLAAYAVFSGSAGATPLVVAIACVLILQWYVRIYSSYGRKKSAAITIGKPLPELAFETIDGEPVSSADFKGSPTLLVFFRGNWCPLCMAQFKEIRDRADRLAKAGVQVKFISNQSAEKSHELDKKMSLPSHFQMLVDKNLSAAKGLSIEDMGGTPFGLPGYPKDTVMATVIALDAGGAVLFGDETDNYRVRPRPDTFFHVFEA